MKPLFLTLLIASVLLEGFLTTIPLVWVILLLGYVWFQKPFFFYAFMAGMALDLFAVNPLGFRSVLFIGMLLIVTLYERKFEIVTLPFILLASFSGSVVFLWIFNYNEILIPSLVGSLIGALFYRIVILRPTESGSE